MKRTLSGCSEFDCSVCLDILKEPRILDCRHAVCLNCVGQCRINHRQKTVACLRCNKRSRFTNLFDGLPDLDQDIVLSTVVSALNQQKRIHEAEKAQALRRCRFHGDELNRICHSCNGIVCASCLLPGGDHHKHSSSRATLESVLQLAKEQQPSWGQAQDDLEMNIRLSADSIRQASHHLEGVLSTTSTVLQGLEDFLRTAQAHRGVLNELFKCPSSLPFNRLCHLVNSADAAVSLASAPRLRDVVDSIENVEQALLAAAASFSATRRRLPSPSGTVTSPSTPMAAPVGGAPTSAIACSTVLSQLTDLSTAFPLPASLADAAPSQPLTTPSAHHTALALSLPHQCDVPKTAPKTATKSTSKPGSVSEDADAAVGVVCDITVPATQPVALLA